MPKIVDHEERRQLIVDGMWKIVQREGFSAVSVRSIASEVGLSKSTIAHYFDNQDQILVLAVEQQIAATTLELDALDVARCTPQVAELAIRLAIPTTPRQRRRSQVWLALLEHHHNSPAVARALREMNAAVRRSVYRVLEALAVNGHVATGRNLGTEAAKIHAVIDGLALQSMTDPRSTPPSLVESVVSAVVRDLATRPTASR